MAWFPGWTVCNGARVAMLVLLALCGGNIVLSQPSPVAAQHTRQSAGQ